jgi:phosphopantetheine adenylyltransferase
MSQEDSTPLWFLLRNPRALGEVEDWLRLHIAKEQKTADYLEAKARTDIIHRTMWLQCCAQIDKLNDLLVDIQKQYEINFPRKESQEPIT